MRHHQASTIVPKRFDHAHVRRFDRLPHGRRQAARRCGAASDGDAGSRSGWLDLVDHMPVVMLVRILWSLLRNGRRER